MRSGFIGQLNKACFWEPLGHGVCIFCLFNLHLPYLMIFLSSLKHVIKKGQFITENFTSHKGMVPTERKELDDRNVFVHAKLAAR